MAVNVRMIGAMIATGGAIAFLPRAGMLTYKATALANTIVISMQHTFITAHGANSIFESVSGRLHRVNRVLTSGALADSRMIRISHRIGRGI
jgi:hypothetical protein